MIPRLSFRYEIRWLKFYSGPDAQDRALSGGIPDAVVIGGADGWLQVAGMFVLFYKFYVPATKRMVFDVWMRFGFGG